MPASGGQSRRRNKGVSYPRGVAKKGTQRVAPQTLTKREKGAKNRVAGFTGEKGVE